MPHWFILLLIPMRAQSKDCFLVLENMALRPTTSQTSFCEKRTSRPNPGGLGSESAFWQDAQVIGLRTTALADLEWGGGQLIPSYGGWLRLHRKQIHHRAQHYNFHRTSEEKNLNLESPFWHLLASCWTSLSDLFTLQNRQTIFQGS